MAEHRTWKLAVKAINMMKSHHNRSISIMQLSSILKAPEDTVTLALQQLQSIHLAVAGEQGWMLTRAGEIYGDAVRQNRRLLGVCIALCTLFLLLATLRFLG